MFWQYLQIGVIRLALKLKVRDKSKRQEARTAKDLGGKTTIASGALVQKGDVFNEHFLVECKTTEKPYYSLTRKVWDKIVKEARNSNLRTAVMRIDISDSDNPMSFAILNEPTFTMMCYGTAVYVLDIVDCNAKSFRVSADRQHFVNSDVVVGSFFSWSDDEKGLVQIDWSDFMTLYRKRYGLDDE